MAVLLATREQRHRGLDSATHTEYLHAEKSGLRIAAWCLDVHDREGHEESFLNEVRAFHVVPAFASPDDLRVQIECARGAARGERVSRQ